MTKLCVPRHDLRRFDWNRGDETLIAEASDLGRGQFWGRLYDDACDEGFEIFSPRTGKTVKFYLDETHRRPDGDVTHRTFKPVIAMGPVREVIVFND